MLFRSVERCRANGITVPIIPGIKPLTSSKQLTALPKVFHVDLPEALIEAVEGCKSEKDVKLIYPMVEKINAHFSSYASLTNDQLRSKTLDFRTRIKEHLKNIDQSISDLNQQAENLPVEDILGKDNIYKEVDELKKKRDEIGRAHV